jgi:hypothetical protein
MTKEVPLQASLFTDDLVDTRTTKQKKAATEQEKPKQAEMFSQRELGQFGVNPHPQIPISPKTRIELALQDMRTEEEKERDFQREVEERSYKLPGILDEAEADSDAL